MSLDHFFQVGLVASLWKNRFGAGFGVCPKPRDLSKHHPDRDLRNTPSTAATEIPAVVSEIEWKMPESDPGMERSPGVLRGKLPSLTGNSYRCDASKTPMGRLSLATHTRSSTSGSIVGGGAPNRLPARSSRRDTPPGRLSRGRQSGWFGRSRDGFMKPFGGAVRLPEGRRF